VAPFTIPLAVLRPKLQRIITPGKTWLDVDVLGDAQGVRFLCPKCFSENGGSVGTHSVICWFLGRGVSADESPGPGRWNALGTGLSDLTLQADSSSVRLTGEGCGAHFFVKAGQVEVLAE
jgi:hypothetical protein